MYRICGLALVSEHDLYRASDRIEGILDLPIILLCGFIRLNGVTCIGVRYSPLVLVVLAEGDAKLFPSKDIIYSRCSVLRPGRVGDGDGVEGVIRKHGGIIAGCLLGKERCAPANIARQVIQIIVNVRAERYTPLAALGLIRFCIRPNGIVILFICVREDAQVCTNILRTEAVDAIDALKLRGGDIVPLGARVKVHAACADILPYAVHGKEQLHACSGVFALLDFFLIGIVASLLVRVCVIVAIGVFVVILIRVVVAAVVPLVRIAAAVVAVVLIRVAVPVVAVRILVGTVIPAGLLCTAACVAVLLLLVLLHLLGLLSLVLFLPHSVDRRIGYCEYTDQR